MFLKMLGKEEVKEGDEKENLKELMPLSTTQEIVTDLQAEMFI